MIGRIDRDKRTALIRATLHMVNREFDLLAADFVALGLLPPDSTASRADVTAALRRVFDSALAGGVRNLNFGGLSTKLGTTMYEFKFQIPQYYTLLVRRHAFARHRRLNPWIAPALLQLARRTRVGHLDVQQQCERACTARSDV